MKILQKVLKLGSPEVPFGVQHEPGAVLPDVTSKEPLLYTLATSLHDLGPREPPIALLLLLRRSDFCCTEKLHN